MVALDALDVRRPVRFIKMDVEGAEPQVVCGAARLLREDRLIILSELHPTQLERASGVSADQFLEQLRALGYRAHRIHRPADHDPAEAGHYQDFIGPAIDRAPADALVSIVLVPS